MLYRPAILGAGSLHCIRAAAGIDQWVDYQCLMPCERGIPKDRWESAIEVEDAFDITIEFETDFGFAELPTGLASATAYKKLTTQFKDYLYRHHALTIYRAPELGKFAPAGLTEGEARVRFTQDVREIRDRETEKVCAKYASKAESLEKTIRAAGDRLDRQRSELNQASVSSVIAIGTSVISAFFGNKTKSRSSSKIDAIVRGATQTAKKKADADRAEEAMRQLSLDLEDLQTSIKIEIDELARKFDVHKIRIEATEIPPRKSDIKIEPLVLIWLPWQIDQHGEASPLYCTGER